MWNARTLAACAFGIVLFTPGIRAQDQLAPRTSLTAGAGRYRDFALRSSLATVAKVAGVAVSEATLIHERPALLQDLDWRPSPWIGGLTAASTDPVEQIVFSFYEDQLFRVVVDYARDRTEGMTDADMIEAIGVVYGKAMPRRAGARPVPSRVENESGSALARWGDAGYGVVLYRTSEYGERFRLIVTESALERLARKAMLDAARLEELDAPRVERARQKKALDDSRAAAGKARAVNKAVFRP
jgi:hypothetical protein